MIAVCRALAATRGLRLPAAPSAMVAHLRSKAASTPTKVVAPRLEVASSSSWSSAPLQRGDGGGWLGLGELALKPALFAVGLTVTGFAAAAVALEERRERERRKSGLLGQLVLDWRSGAQRSAATVQQCLQQAMRGGGDNPVWLQVRDEARPGTMLLEAHSSEVVVGSIVAANLLVAAGWAVLRRRAARLGWDAQALYLHRADGTRALRALGPLAALSTLTVLHPQAGRALPLLGCAFAHSGPLHLGCNMYVLASFGEELCRAMGPEHFVALYASAAACSSLGSLLVKLATNRRVPSLGASGAVLGLMSIFMIAKPETQLQLIFLPGWQFSAQDALAALVAFDLAGLTVGRMLGWSVIDHGGHLAAVAFGYLYVHHGHQLAQRLQEVVTAEWRGVRRELRELRDERRR